MTAPCSKQSLICLQRKLSIHRTAWHELHVDEACSTLQCAPSLCSVARGGPADCAFTPRPRLRQAVSHNVVGACQRRLEDAVRAVDQRRLRGRVLALLRRARGDAVGVQVPLQPLVARLERRGLHVVRGCAPARAAQRHMASCGAEGEPRGTPQPLQPHHAGQSSSCCYFSPRKCKCAQAQQAALHASVA